MVWRWCGLSRVADRDGVKVSARMGGPDRGGEASLIMTDLILASGPVSQDGMHGNRPAVGETRTCCREMPDTKTICSYDPQMAAAPSGTG